MYAEAGLLFPSYLQWFTQENNLHHLQSQTQTQTQSQSQEDDDDEIFFRLHAPNPNYQNLPGYAATNSVNTNNPVTIVRPRDEVSAQIFGSNSNWDIGTLLQNSMVSEYDMGGEGDLFKAPEPIIEEPELDLDPMTAAISMISSGNDLTAAEAIKVAEIESIRNEHLLDEVFYECKKDLLAKSAIEEQFLELSDVKIPALQIEDDPTEPKNKSVTDGAIQKSVSSGCLKSMEWISGGASMRPNFLEFQGMDLGTALGLRRAYSEGDIQALGYGNTSLPNTSTVHPPIERLISIGNQKIEERRQKLSRYRKKKSKRNFGRKIKYACRKALADSQPRVRGRFAKTEESDVAKPF